MNVFRVILFLFVVLNNSMVFASDQISVDEANGTKTATERKTDLDKQIKDENYISNLTALGSAYATVGLMTYCTPYSTDVYIGAGSGILWVAAEIMSALEYKKSSQKIEQDFIEKYNSKSENFDVQVDGFKTLKNSYVDTQTAIEMKLKMQRYAQMGYLGASAIAGVSAYTNVFSRVPMTCNFTSAKNSIKMPLLYQAINKYFIKEAHSATTPFWFIGGAGAVILSKIVATQKLQLTTMTIQPETRAIAWLAIAGLLQGSIKRNEEILETINKNISKIDMINKNLQFMKDGGLSYKLTEKEYKLKKEALFSEDIKLSSEPSEKIICASSGTLGECQKIEGKLAPMSDFGGLPSSMKTIASNVAKVSDSVSGSSFISGATLGAIDQQNQKGVTVTKALRKKALELIKRNNETYKYKGQNSDGFASDMLKATQVVLKEENVTPENMYRLMASYNPKEIGSPSNMNKKEIGSMIKNTMDRASVGNGQEFRESKNNELDLGFGEFKEQVSDVELSGERVVNERATKNQQIAEAEGKSLFEILSSRYRQTGYKFLLEEE